VPAGRPASKPSSSGSIRLGTSSAGEPAVAPSPSRIQSQTGETPAS
jgi:hypothetical protein